MSTFTYQIIAILIVINIQFIVTQNEKLSRALSDVQLTKLELDSSRTVLRLLFDGDTSRGPNGTTINCQYYFVNSTMLGEESKCEWSSSSTLTVYLGRDANISLNKDKLEIKTGTIKDMNDDYIEGESEITLIEDHTDIMGVIHGPNVVYKYHNLFLDGSKSIGRGIKDFDYIWNITACVQNICDDIEQLNDIREVMVNTPQLNLNVSRIPIMYNLLISLKVVNYLNEESDTVEFKVILTEESIPQVILYSPIFEVPSNEPYVFIDTLILNADESSLKYKWQVSPLVGSPPNIDVKDMIIPTSALPLGVPVDFQLLVNDLPLAQTKVTVKYNIENSFIDGGDRTFYISNENNLILDGSKVPLENEEVFYIWDCHYNENSTCRFSDKSDIMESVTTRMKILTFPTATMAKKLPPGDYMFTLSIKPQIGNVTKSQYRQKITLKEHPSLESKDIPSDVSVNVLNSRLMNLHVYDEYPLKLEMAYRNPSTIALSSPYGKIKIGDALLPEANINCVKFDKYIFTERHVNSAEMQVIATSENNVNSSSLVSLTYHNPPFKRFVGDFDIESSVESIFSYFQFIVLSVNNWQEEYHKPLLRSSFYFNRNGKEIMLTPPSSNPYHATLLPAGDSNGVLRLTLRMYDTYGSYADITKGLILEQRENENIDELLDFHSTFERDEKRRMMMNTIIVDFLYVRNMTGDNRDKAISLLLDELDYFSSQKVIDDFTFNWIIQTLEYMTNITSDDNSYERIFKVLKILPYANIARREEYINSIISIMQHIIQRTDEDIVLEMVEVYDKVMAIKMKSICSGESLEPFSSSYFETEYAILKEPYTNIEMPRNLVHTYNSPKLFIPKSFIESVTDEQSIIIRYSRLNMNSVYLDTESDFDGIPVSVELLMRDGVTKIEFNNTNSTFDVYWPQTQSIEGKCIWKKDLKSEWDQLGCDEHTYEDKVLCKCNHMTIFSFSLKEKKPPIWIWILVGVLAFILLVFILLLIICIVKKRRDKKKSTPVDSRETLTPFPTPITLSEENFEQLRKFKPVISDRNLINLSKGSNDNENYEREKTLSTSEISGSQSNDSPLDYYSSFRSGKAFDEIELDLRLRKDSFGRRFDKKNNSIRKGRRDTGSSTKISRALNLSDYENDHDEDIEDKNKTMLEESDDTSQS